MTEKLFYRDPYLKEFETEVVAVVSDDSGIQKCSRFKVALNQTAFYPEGGGQPADHGTINGIPVIDVHEKDGVIWHTCECNKPEVFAPGKKVKCVIDWKRRFDHMQQHSGEHIVSGMLCNGFNCDNIGFHMGEQIVQIDYNADISWEEVLNIEAKANQYIIENHEFVEMWPNAAELEKLSYRSKKALTGAVRITSFPGADICACCGTHVRFSSEVGLVKMLSVQKIKEGVRIEMVSGKRAFDFLSQTWNQNLQISQLLSAKQFETYQAVQKQRDDMMKLRGRISELEDDYFKLLSDSYDGANDPLIITGPMESESVRRLCDAIAEKATGCCKVFAGEDGAYKYAVINKGNDIRNMIKEMNSALNGRGGGRDGFAQGNAACTAEEIRRYCF